MNHIDFTCILISICLFGLSDFIVNKLFKTDMLYLLFYLIIGIVGLGLAYYENKNKKNNNK